MLSHLQSTVCVCAQDTKEQCQGTDYFRPSQLLAQALAVHCVQSGDSVWIVWVVDKEGTPTALEICHPTAARAVMRLKMRHRRGYQEQPCNLKIRLPCCGNLQ